MEKKYTWLSDPGHGWLIVPVKDVTEVGCHDKITGYSYPIKHGDTLYIYLEEDCDAGTFIDAAVAYGWAIETGEEYTEHFNRNRVGFDPAVHK